MTDDPFDNPEAQAWLQDVRENMVPKLASSGAAAMLVPDEVDPKFAIELGYAIMLDKPILAIVQSGTKAPDRLIRVADKIIELGPDGFGGDFHERLGNAVKEVLGE